MSALARLQLVSAAASLRDVWCGEELARQEAVVASGFAPLDAALPGGGWPVGSLVELLQARPEQHVWQLLAPALAAHGQAAQPVVLVGAPLQPFGPSLQAQSLAPQRLLRVQADKPVARLWAAEQALRCVDVAAVLAWLPQAKSAELHRLHLAAQQHGKLLFVLRGLQARNESSPARLRLCVEGAQTLQVRILKRRGPPLEAPLELPAHPARLAALLQARKGKAAAPSSTSTSPRSRSHVLDRTAALA
jgi:protein ImuA